MEAWVGGLSKNVATTPLGVNRRLTFSSKGGREVHLIIIYIYIATLFQI